MRRSWRLAIGPTMSSPAYVELATSMFVPATRAGILARNFAVRLWPLIAAAQRLGRGRVAETVSPG